MFDFMIKEVNVEIHWIYALLQFIGLYLLVLLFSFIRVNNTLKTFSQGKLDEKLIKKCKSIKRQYYSRKDKKVYNMFCAVIAAIALEIKQPNLFFENLNDFKNIDDDSKKRLFILFLSYMNGERYTNLLNECKKLANDKQYSEEQIFILYKNFGINEEKAIDFLKTENFNVHNYEVIMCIDELINLLKEKTTPTTT